MKRIAAAAVLLLTSVIPVNGFAQIGLNKFIVVAGGAPDPNPFDDLVYAVPLMAQQFTLSSPAYISEIDMALQVQSEVTCTFSVAMTRSLGPGSGYGSPVLLQSETSIPSGPSGNYEFSDTFPAVLLPVGTYFLVVDETTGTNPCSNALPGPHASTGLGWHLAAHSSPEVGTVGVDEIFEASFSPTWFVDTVPEHRMSFVLAGPIFPPPTGGGSGQIARLIVQGPVIPAPGGPVEAQIGFVNAATGTLAAPLSSVTLNTGQAQSVDVPLTPLVAHVGQHVDLLPVIAQPPGAAQGAPIQLSSTVQIFDAVTGFGSVLSPALQPGAPVPAFGPQILAGGQTLRVTVVAGTDPCVGQVAFNDLNGNPLVQSTPLNLIPGTGTSVDLNADTLSLKLGQRIEVQPALTVTAPAAAVPLNSVCQASAEVFDRLSGRTWSYQSTMAALPAVQSPAAAPQ